MTRDEAFKLYAALEDAGYRPSFGIRDKKYRIAVSCNAPVAFGEQVAIAEIAQSSGCVVHEDVSPERVVLQLGEVL